MGDKIGRRNVIGLGWMLGGLSFAGMLFGPSNMAMVVGLYSLGLFFLIGPYSAALFFISESFPTSIRATGWRDHPRHGTDWRSSRRFGATPGVVHRQRLADRRAVVRRLAALFVRCPDVAARHVRPETVQ